MIRAILLLGNPGKDYEKTRHNAGTLCMEALSGRLNVSTWNKKLNTEYAFVPHPAGSNDKIMIARSLGFMNLCGQDLKPLLDFFKITPDSILVLHDDLETPYGTIKLKANGGHGGHNGLRSLDQHLGTQNYLRIKIGIGRPVHGDVASYVLSRFNKDEEAVWALVADKVAELVVNASMANDNAMKGLIQDSKEVKCFQGA